MQGEKAAWLLLRAAQGEVKPVLVASKINMMQTAMRATTIIAEVATRPLPFPPTLWEPLHLHRWRCRTAASGRAAPC